MIFLCNLLRPIGLYIFRALLAHPQEVLDKRYLVYCLRVISVACIGVKVELLFSFNPGAGNSYNTHAIYQVPLVWRLLRMSK
jgi:hypothetical protein